MKRLIAILLLLFSITFSINAHAASGYHVIRKLHLGGEDGWDYLAMDSTHHRLYVSRGTYVMVIDTETNKPVGTIPNTPGVHGIALAPHLRTGFTSNGKANTATAFDLDSLRLISQVHTGEDPDAILYEPVYLRVFTFNGKSNDTTIISAVTGSVLRTISLDGRPEFGVTDNKGRVFVNIKDKNEVMAMDSATLSITKRYPIKPCEEPTGMAIDVKHHLIFSGCRNKIMTVLDYAAGKVTATVPIGAGVDAVAYDATRGLIFSSNGEGTLTVARASSPGKFETETVRTQPGARTMALDSKTGRIYLPAAEFGPPPAPTPDDPKPRPAMKKGSFTLLVVGK